MLAAGQAANLTHMVFGNHFRFNMLEHDH